MLQLVVQSSWVHYTTSCKIQSSAPEDGQNNYPKHTELIEIINKLLLLHQVGCLWCRVLLEKLAGLQLVKKFPHFMEPEGSLPHSQASATRPYPGLAQSTQHTYNPLPGDPS